MALVQKAFSDIITFSRSSNATRIGPTGLVEYAPHNLLVQSQTFGTTWTQTRTSVTSNLVAAPDGTVTADAFYDSAGSGGQPVISQGVTTTAQRHTFSVYAKYLNKQWIRLTTSLFSFGTTYFDIQNGVIGSVNANHTASISNVGNGWYRIAISFESTASSVTFYLEGAGGNGVPSYTPVAGEGYYIWGAQLSVGPYPLDYTPTTSAAVYGPRFDYDPVTLAARGLLIEESRTNLLTYSEQFDNAAWTTGNSSVSANSTTAPSGSNTADTIIEASTTSQHIVGQFGISVTSSSAYTVSVYAKASGRNFLNVRVNDNNSNDNAASIVVNVSTGVITGVATAYGTFSAASGSVAQATNGFYRIQLTFTTSVSLIAVKYELSDGSARTADGQSSAYTGDGTSGVFLWGAQLETGSFATSYIPTVASTVTRSADVASVNTLSPFYNAVEGTLFVEASSNANVNYPGIAFFAGTGYRAIGFYYGPVSTESGFEVGDVSGQVGIGLTALAKPATNKFAGAYKANDFAACVNGGTVGTDTSGTVPTVSSLKLGVLYNGTYELNGHIRRLAYYPRRLSNAELAALSA